MGAWAFVNPHVLRAALWASKTIFPLPRLVETSTSYLLKKIKGDL